MYTRIHFLHIIIEDHSSFSQNAMYRIISQLQGSVFTVVVIVIILHMNSSVKKIYQSFNSLVTETDCLLPLYPEASSVIPVTKCSCSILHLWYPMREWCWTQLKIRWLWQGIRWYQHYIKWVESVNSNEFFVIITISTSTVSSTHS